MPKSAGPQLGPLGRRLALTCAAAGIAELSTMPIDALKTQLQLQQQRSGGKGAFQLARELGLRGLYAGASAAVLRHCFYTSTRLTLYEWLRGAAASPARPAAASHAAASHAASTTSSLAVKLLCGATAGAVGQLVAVPADLVKVQLQADVRRFVSGQQQQRQFSSVRDVARSLMRHRGLAGMWRGGVPAVVRAALVNLGELSTYDSAKQAVLESGQLPDGLPTHLSASLCSGLVSAVVSCPADVVKTRLMAQQQQQQQQQQGQQVSPCASTSGAAATQHQARTAGNSGSIRTSVSTGQRHYTGMLDCAVSTVRQEGLAALYKGLLPTYLRLAPWQLVFWCSYEWMRGAAGLSTF